MKVSAGFIVAAIAVCIPSTYGFWGKAREPDWDAFAVTFFKYSKMPMTTKQAAEDGWKMISDCGEIPNFAGKRYTKDDGTVILIFDQGGQIAGIQNAAPATVTEGQFRKSPFVRVGNTLYLTAYFIQPSTICTSNNRDKGYVGDELLLQVGQSYRNLWKMPMEEKDIAGTQWTKGKCFYGMGQHYWYNLSADMDCDNFYPVFLMYNGGKLNSFGWAMGAMLKGSRYEHPTWDKLGWFFQPETKPTCLKDAKGLSTLHIYLQRRPYLNFC